MGEGQILAQVKQVHKVGQNAPGFGRHLNGLFKQAVTAGKRVRSETSISSGAVSVSSAAAELAQLKLPTHDFNDAKVGALLRLEEAERGVAWQAWQTMLAAAVGVLAGRVCQSVAAALSPAPLPPTAPQVCIIGAGKMSKLLVKHMHSKGCTRMTVLNRSLPRAEVRLPLLQPACWARLRALVG